MQTTSLTSKISSAALLVLASLPIAALATAGHAATVKVYDLNLATPAGKAAYEQRVDQAARDFCTTERSVSAKRICREGVKAELTEKLAALQANQTQFAAR